MIKYECDDCKSLATKSDVYNPRNYGDDTDYVLCDTCRAYRMAWCVSVVPPGRLTEITCPPGLKVTRFRGFKELAQEVCHSEANS